MQLVQNKKPLILGATALTVAFFSFSSNLPSDAQLSEPVKLVEFWQAYAHDIDSNVFSLRQVVDLNLRFSVPVLELETNKLMLTKIS